jgi:hypothetical protein
MVMMSNWLMPAFCVSFLAAVPSVPHAGGRLNPSSPTTITNPAITFAPGYSVPSVYWSVETSGPNFPNNGDHLLILGKVASFQAPFEDLDPSDPAVEFTYRMRDFAVVTTGIWDDFAHNEGGISVEYGGGILEIYRDASPDADFADASTFADGELLLSATVSKLLFVLYSSRFPAQTGQFAFTGGSLFDRVSEEGVALTGTNQGTFRMHPDLIPDALENLGYNAVSETTINIDPGVAVTPTTWGRIKAHF